MQSDYLRSYGSILKIQNPLFCLQQEINLSAAVTLILTMETMSKGGGEVGGVERLEDDAEEKQSAREVNVELKSISMTCK